MKEFCEKYPDVQFDLYNGMADNIKDMIGHGLLDLGLVMEPVDTAKFEYIRLPQKETWGILVRKDHELPGRRSVHTCRFRSLFPPDFSGAHYQKRDSVEKNHLFSRAASLFIQTIQEQ